jgi:hypothetical protein
MVLSPPHRHALEVVSERLLGWDLPWAVTGSVALALHGLDVACRDLDLVTTAARARELEAAFDAEVVEPMALSSGSGLRAHRGMLRIDGVPVEILGDVQNPLPDGGWTEPPDIDAHRQWVTVGRWRCPVLSLEYLGEAYRLMGRDPAACQARLS